jgi:hypothetical protein
MDQYRQKPKKPYNGPPRPNLMSQDKELRGLKDRFNLLVQEVAHVQDENRQLKNRIDFLEHRIDRILNQRKF